MPPGPRGFVHRGSGLGAGLLAGALLAAAAKAVASARGAPGAFAPAPDAALVDGGEKPRPDAMPDVRRPGPLVGP